jgi:collagenase-like PrtC family protease
MIDLLGADLPLAIKLLQAAGADYEVLTTTSPFGAPLDGIERVVRQEIRDGVYRLTVCKVPDSFR